MTTEQILSKWEDLKEHYIYDTKRFNKDLALALKQDLGELSQEDIDKSFIFKKNLADIENKWDLRIDIFIDQVEDGQIPPNIDFTDVLENFGRIFFKDLNTVFPTIAIPLPEIPKTKTKQEFDLSEEDEDENIEKLFDKLYNEVEGV